MAIIALLMLLSVSAFIILRSQAMADEAAEEILTTIRESQNRAISITPDSAGNDTKVWVAAINSGGYGLISLYGNTGLSSYTERPIQKKNGVDIVLKKSSGPVNDAYVSFAAPFAKPYVLTDNNCLLAGGCIWEKSQRPTEEWQTINDTNVKLSGDLRIIVSKNSAVASVIVKTNGDAYIE